MQQKYAKDSLNDTIESLNKKSENKLIISKYKDEIVKLALKDVKPDDYDNEEKIDQIIGIVGKGHFKELGIGGEDDGGTTKTSKKVGDSSDAGGAGGLGTETLSDDAIRDAANSSGLDLESPEGRKQARALALARQKREKAKSW